ncbi:MAG: hypothetical protein ACKO96_18235, partial [Flammeovirgaceae bacterium]
ILIFNFSIVGFTQTQEVTVENQDGIIRKDSLGNFLTHKQALDLLRTGKYVSVPTINHRMEVETVIRKPRKEDKGRYQSFTDGNMVFSTTGLQNKAPRLNLGDTIPPAKVVDKHGQRLTLTNNSNLTRNTLLVFIKEYDATWRDDIQPFIKLLSIDYSNVNFVICPRITDSDNLTSYFNGRVLKQADNLFIAESDFIKSMSIEYFTTHMIIDSSGKVKLWLPPLPSDVAFPLLKKYLSTTEKERE